jgi:hypothetical protein
MLIDTQISAPITFVAVDQVGGKFGQPTAITDG